MAETYKSKYTAFWLILLVLLFFIGTLVLFRDVLTRSESVAEETQPPSSEWTTAPQDGVKVDLPETPMRNDEPESTPTEDSNAGEPDYSPLAIQSR